MIEVEYKGIKGVRAKYHPLEMKWTSDNEAFARFLNDTVPDELYDRRAICFEGKKVDGFKVDGLDGLALSVIEEDLRKKIKVVKYVPEKIPKEKPGVDY